MINTHAQLESSSLPQKCLLWPRWSCWLYLIVCWPDLLAGQHSLRALHGPHSEIQLVGSTWRLTQSGGPKKRESLSSSLKSLLWEEGSSSPYPYQHPQDYKIHNTRLFSAYSNGLRCEDLRMPESRHRLNSYQDKHPPLPIQFLGRMWFCVAVD